MNSPWLARISIIGLLSTAAQVAAQEPPPTTAPPADAATPPPAGVAPAPEPPPPEAATPVPVTAPAEVNVAAEIATLKAEVAELKAKAEEAELAALTAEAPAETALAEQPVRIYGFMDFGLDKWFFRDPDDDGLLLLRPSDATTFVFGNLNLYLDANPVENVHSLIEIRLTLAPHGEEISLGPPINATSYERVDTVAFDFSSPSSQAQLRLGGIYIERAWTEYKFSELFKLQWGLYLNPFGIWNLDHGSPTLISLMLPTFIASQMVPGRLLGVSLYGSAFLGASELGYAVHVSNGRTPLDFDFTEDKAIGLRAYVANEGDFGRLVFGASGYIGTYDDRIKRVAATPDDLISFEDVIDYNEQVLGLDVALDVGDFRVRSEAVFRWIRYDGDESERIFSLDGSEQYLPNRLEWDAYALFAYRTPWNFEPYVQLELSHKSYILPRFAGTYRATGVGPTPFTASLGFNIELTTHTLLKFQLAWVRVYADENLKDYSSSTPFMFVRLVNSF